jgi:hypothetical protein
MRFFVESINVDHLPLILNYDGNEAFKFLTLQATDGVGIPFLLCVILNDGLSSPSLLIFAR